MENDSKILPEETISPVSTSAEPSTVTESRRIELDAHELDAINSLVSQMHIPKSPQSDVTTARRSSKAVDKKSSFSHDPNDNTGPSLKLPTTSLSELSTPINGLSPLNSAKEKDKDTFTITATTTTITTKASIAVPSTSTKLSLSSASSKPSAKVQFDVPTEAPAAAAPAAAPAKRRSLSMLIKTNTMPMKQMSFMMKNDDTKSDPTSFENAKKKAIELAQDLAAQKEEQMKQLKLELAKRLQEEEEKAKRGKAASFGFHSIKGGLTVHDFKESKRRSVCYDPVTNHSKIADALGLTEGDKHHHHHHHHQHLVPIESKQSLMTIGKHLHLDVPGALPNHEPLMKIEEGNEETPLPSRQNSRPATKQQADHPSAHHNHHHHTHSHGSGSRDSPHDHSHSHGSGGSGGGGGSGNHSGHTSLRSSFSAGEHGNSSSGASHHDPSHHSNGVHSAGAGGGHHASADHNTSSSSSHDHHGVHSSHPHHHLHQRLHEVMSDQLIDQRFGWQGTMTNQNSRSKSIKNLAVDTGSGSLPPTVGKPRQHSIHSHATASAAAAAAAVAPDSPTKIPLLLTPLSAKKSSIDLTNSPPTRKKSMTKQKSLSKLHSEDATTFVDKLIKQRSQLLGSFSSNTDDPLAAAAAAAAAFGEGVPRTTSDDNMSLGGGSLVSTNESLAASLASFTSISSMSQFKFLKVKVSKPTDEEEGSSPALISEHIAKLDQTVLSHLDRAVYVDPAKMVTWREVAGMTSVSSQDSINTILQPNELERQMNLRTGKLLNAYRPWSKMRSKSKEIDYAMIKEAFSRQPSTETTPSNLNTPPKSSLRRKSRKPVDRKDHHRARKQSLSRGNSAGSVNSELSGGDKSRTSSAARRPDLKVTISEELPEDSGRISPTESVTSILTSSVNGLDFFAGSAGSVGTGPGGGGGGGKTPTNRKVMPIVINVVKIQ